ncbi:hypothetical protein JXA85_06835 [Candidatus Woesearchaeota archaeon]|nr:hypothetical protein [Candidatus Woesearchaeota archaeon]
MGDKKKESKLEEELSTKDSEKKEEKGKSQGISPYQWGNRLYSFFEKTIGYASDLALGLPDLIYSGNSGKKDYSKKKEKEPEAKLRPAT